jgi:hypothetical protein
MEQNYALTLEGIKQQEEPLSMFNLPMEGGQQQSPMAPMFSSMMQTSGQQPELTKQVQQQLSKLEIDPTGLSFSPVGQIQLRSRLEKQFGASYMTVPGVSDLLKNFENYMDQNKGEAKQAGYAAYAGGKRTLAALLGGKE